MGERIAQARPLSHFAREGWLGPPKAIIGERQALVPDTVVEELRMALRATAVSRPHSPPWSAALR